MLAAAPVSEAPLFPLVSSDTVGDFVELVSVPAADFDCISFATTESFFSSQPVLVDSNGPDGLKLEPGVASGILFPDSTASSVAFLDSSFVSSFTGVEGNDEKLLVVLPMDGDDGGLNGEKGLGFAGSLTEAEDAGLNGENGLGFGSVFSDVPSTFGSVSLATLPLIGLKGANGFGGVGTPPLGPEIGLNGFDPNDGLSPDPEDVPIEGKGLMVVVELLSDAPSSPLIFSDFTAPSVALLDSSFES